MATKLVLNTLIFLVLRSGDTLEQLISQRGSYLNKICLHIFLNLAECSCSRSGHYLLLAVLHRGRKQRQVICLSSYVLQAAPPTAKSPHHTMTLCK